MPVYRVRAATLDDIDTLVHHRLAMFAEMGSAVDTAAVGPAFRRWLAVTMPAGTYKSWVAESENGGVVAGGGITVLPWPPGPHDIAGRIAYAYNVYTEPAHRRQGLARTIMEAIHAWCRGEGIGVVGLNASVDGEGLYASMGYRPAASPTMFVSL